MIVVGYAANIVNVRSKYRRLRAESDLSILFACVFTKSIITMIVWQIFLRSLGCVSVNGPSRVNVSLSLCPREKDWLVSRSITEGEEEGGTALFPFPMYLLYPLHPCKRENDKNIRSGYSCRTRCQVPRSWTWQGNLRRFPCWFSSPAIFHFNLWLLSLISM